ncbi:flagellar filament structural protein (flagellin) [Cupriavidus taiwanensis]|uniref:Flagellin n=1 Tax=Cupriavidus taiwanensis TaxID=164546 RepID=A0A375D4W5_9BURK|nr:FliC/FljB family flagellin [Cupriavidus taiwanensis]SOY93186.1 flagellar filament structural protein (flagellin) [Cupriavidus taiwanensis]SOY96567.1 flagellar filament structural protein (flagellin) [Cupriavidus taiwanensis]SPD68902.1 flagellar filament structural protein (flagellin) [Cupriavidus taiwanensis]
MSMVINTNTLSLMTQNNLSASQSSLNNAIQRLSSGLRINSAKDDAAGQAIANRFTANINGLSQAQRNANDGISLAQTTEGALTEVNNNLQAIRTLAVQAATGSNSTSDLKSIQDEITQRMAEIDRTSVQTDFNGVKVLSSTAASLKVQVGAQDGQTISIDLKEISAKTLGMTGFTVAKNALGTSAAITNVTTASGATPVGVNLTTAAGNLGVNASDLTLHNVLTSAGAATQQYVVKSGSEYYAASVNSTTGAVTLNTATVNVADVANGNSTGSNVTQYVKVGADTTGTAQAYVTQGGNNYQLDANTALTNGGTTATTYSNPTTIQLSTAGSATATTTFTGSGTTNPLAVIDKALSTVDQLRSSLGAVQNRFNSAITNLGSAVTNLSASRSRIQDADYATEVSNMSRAQILQQAGTSVLAQANQTTQNVLSLLR